MSWGHWVIIWEVAANVVWKLVSAASSLLGIRADNGNPVLGIGAENCYLPQCLWWRGKIWILKAFNSSSAITGPKEIKGASYNKEEITERKGVQIKDTMEPVTLTQWTGATNIEAICVKYELLCPSYQAQLLSNTTKLLYFDLSVFCIFYILYSYVFDCRNSAHTLQLFFLPWILSHLAMCIVTQTPGFNPMPQLKGKIIQLCLLNVSFSKNIIASETLGRVIWPLDFSDL